MTKINNNGGVNNVNQNTGAAKPKAKKNTKNDKLFQGKGKAGANNADLKAQQAKEAKKKEAANKAAKAKAEKLQKAAKNNKTCAKVTVKGNTVTTKKKDGTVVKQTVNAKGVVTDKTKTTKGKNGKTTTTETKYNGKTGAKTQTTKTTKAKNGKTTTTQIKYDDNGKKTNQNVQVTKNGKNIKTTNSTYKDGKLANKQITEGSGDKTVKTRIDYSTNKKGETKPTQKTVTQKINGKETKVETQYNADGKRTSVVTTRAKDDKSGVNDPGATIVKTANYKYDDKGRCVSKVVKDADTNKTTTTTYSDYNDKGTQRKGKIVVEVDGKKTEYTVNQKLNKDGKVTNSEKFNADGRKISQVEYDYDKNGKKVAQSTTHFYEDGSKRQEIKSNFKKVAGGMQYDVAVATYDKDGKLVKVAKGTRTTQADGSVIKGETKETNATAGIKRAWEKLVDFFKGNDDISSDEAQKEIKNLYDDLGFAISDKLKDDEANKVAPQPTVNPAPNPAPKPQPIDDENVVIGDDGTRTAVKIDKDGTKTTTVTTPDGKVTTFVNRATDGFINQIKSDGVEITDIGTGGCSGNWFANLKLDGVLYSRTGEVAKDVDGGETYTMKKYPDDGSTVVCRMASDESKIFTVKDEDGNVKTSVAIDKDGNLLRDAVYTVDSDGTVSNSIVNEDGETITHSNHPDGTTSKGIKRNNGSQVTAKFRPDSNLMTDVKFNGNEITNIGTGGCAGNWFVNFELNGVHYSRPQQCAYTPEGHEVYKMETYPKIFDQEVVCIMKNDGSQVISILDWTQRHTQLIEVDKDGNIAMFEDSQPDYPVG